MLRAMEHAPTPSLSVVFIFQFAIESIKESGGALVLIVVIFFSVLI
jgi:hypothetical protein